MRTWKSSGALFCGVLLLSSAQIVSYADSNTSTTSIHRTQLQEKTAIITAKGTLEGSMTPFIEGLPFTGNISLHYSATNTGFVDGDISVITIKLPDEFKYIASVPELKEALIGSLHTQTILGQKTVRITPEMVEVYPDRIIINTPHSFWIGIGKTSADININYGEFLTKYPKLIIPDAPNGYCFITQLQYSSSMWDVIKNPILGTDTDTYITSEKSAIVK